MVDHSMSPSADVSDETTPATSTTATSPDELTPICNIITPVGMLGYGLHGDQTAAALANKLRNGAATALILDSGSTDSGPEKLALGCMTVPRDNYVRDLTKLLKLAWNFRVPLIFSSAGGDGSDEHVREMQSVVEEIAEDAHYRLKTISIFSGIDKALVSHRLTGGMATGCGKSVPDLTQDKIQSTIRIVAQMGPEPILEAMVANPDFNVLITGRAYDPAPYIAYAAFVSNASLEKTATLEGQHLWGGFAHMGKILECGGTCAVPKSHGAMATVYRNGTFDVTPLDPVSRCTRTSVAAHTLYEKSRPDVLYAPGGYLELADIRTEALADGRSVRVSGGIFRFDKDAGRPYTVKLEGAEVVGYRSQMMGSFKDPILIGQLDNYLQRVKAYVSSQHKDAEGTWELDFHIYGQQPLSTSKCQPSEVFIIGEALASTQELATSVASITRIAVTHGPYPGQKATSGNFAYGLGGKMEYELGPCAQFSIYHLMQLKTNEELLLLSDRSCGLFAQEVVTLGVTEEAAVSAVAPRVDSDTYQASDNGTTPKVDSNTNGTEKSNPRTLGDISKLLRSKNAGPYEITLDVMFDSKVEYQLVKQAKILTTASMARLFAMREDEIVWDGFFDHALAYKVTIPRLRNGKPATSGGYMENDVHGSQMYIGLMNMELPDTLVQDWKRLQEG